MELLLPYEIWIFVAAVMFGVSVYKMDSRVTWQRAMTLTVVVGIVGFVGRYAIFEVGFGFLLTISSALRYAVTGLVLAFALRLIYPTLNQQQLLIIVCGWAAAGALELFLLVNGSTTIIAATVNGFIGGGAIAWGLHSAKPALSLKYAGIVAGGWALARTVGTWYQESFGELFGLPII